MVKHPSANAGDIRDLGLIPGLGRSPGEGNAIHSSILAWNPMYRGAWWATVHGIAKSQTRLKHLTYHARPPIFSPAPSFFPPSFSPTFPFPLSSSLPSLLPSFIQQFPSILFQTLSWKRLYVVAFNSWLPSAKEKDPYTQTQAKCLW